jgi:hypothetical protein
MPRDAVKRLTIHMHRQRLTVAFGIEVYRFGDVFLLVLKLWPVGITIRYGEPPTEITNWQEYDAA